ARTAIQEGDFDPDLDCEQFAHDLNGIALSYSQASRLLKDPKARARADRACEALVQSARSTRTTAGARRRSTRRAPVMTDLEFVAMQNSTSVRSPGLPLAARLVRPAFAALSVLAPALAAGVVER